MLLCNGSKMFEVFTSLLYFDTDKLYKVCIVCSEPDVYRCRSVASVLGLNRGVNTALVLCWAPHVGVLRADTVFRGESRVVGVSPVLVPSIKVSNERICRLGVSMVTPSILRGARARLTGLVGLLGVTWVWGTLTIY